MDVLFSERAIDKIESPRGGWRPERAVVRILNICGETLKTCVSRYSIAGNYLEDPIRDSKIQVLGGFYSTESFYAEVDLIQYGSVRKTHCHALTFDVSRVSVSSSVSTTKDRGVNIVGLEGRKSVPILVAVPEFGVLKIFRPNRYGGNRLSFTSEVGISEMSSVIRELKKWNNDIFKNTLRWVVEDEVDGIMKRYKFE